MTCKHNNLNFYNGFRCKTPYERAGTLLTSIAKDFCVVTRLFNDDDDDGEFNCYFLNYFFCIN